MRAHGSLTRTQTVSAEDERGIRDVLMRYATGIDTRNWALFRSCFSHDVEADYGTFGTWHGPREVVEYMESAHRNLGPTLHRITNIVVENHNGEVLARSYVDAILTEATEGGRTHRAAGYYDDALIRTSEGWKISRRRFTMVKAG